MRCPLQRGLSYPELLLLQSVSRDEQAQYANKNSLRDIKADIRRLIELECCEAEPEAVLSSAGLGYLIGKMRAVDKDWEESY